MALLNYSGKNVLGICLKSGEIVRLLPGINEVSEDHLSFMKSHPLFQTRQTKGFIQIMAEKLDKDGKRSVEEMVKNIPQIFDTKLLKKLIETDGRELVIIAAKSQLEKIKNPSKAKAEESSEHFA